jgi:hypothetical protein
LNSEPLTLASLRGRLVLVAFLSEYRITFPVGIDRHDDRLGSIPATMRAYDLQGTPSQILLDRQGRARSITFGTVGDLEVGTRIGRLLAEPHPSAANPGTDQTALPVGSHADRPPSACEPGLACR